VADRRAAAAAVVQGYDKYFMSEGLQVYLVDSPRHIPDALSKLKASMTVSGQLRAVCHASLHS
jgi:hypothetical protein